MVADNIWIWEAAIVDCPSTSKATKVAIVRGGESLTVKSLASAGKAHLLMSRQDGSATQRYRLDKGDTALFELPLSFGVNNAIEIWALPETAGDDVTWYKLLNNNPKHQSDHLTGK